MTERPDLIDRSMMLEDLDSVDPKYQNEIDFCKKVLTQQPKVKADPVQYGRWMNYGLAFKCSGCGAIFNHNGREKRCGFCGRYMREPESKDAPYVDDTKLAMELYEKIRELEEEKEMLNHVIETKGEMIEQMTKYTIALEKRLEEYEE